MKLSGLCRIVVFVYVASLGAPAHAASDKDRTALEKTGEAIRAAFAKGELPRP